MALLPFWTCSCSRRPRAYQLCQNWWLSTWPTGTLQQDEHRTHSCTIHDIETTYKGPIGHNPRSSLPCLGPVGQSHLTDPSGCMQPCRLRFLHNTIEKLVWGASPIVIGRGARVAPRERESHPNKAAVSSKRGMALAAEHGLAHPPAAQLPTPPPPSNSVYLAISMIMVYPIQ